MQSLFESIAHENHDDQRKMRRAVALAKTRIDARFGGFLKAAGNDAENWNARVAFIQDEVNGIISTVASEEGVSVENLRRAGLPLLAYSPVAETGRTASVREARKPKMCPYHSEVVDISLAEGSPAAGFNAMAQHAWSDKHCQGEFEGSCNFKREMTTQSYWDEKKEEAEARKLEREQQAEESAIAEAPENQPTEENPVDTEPVATEEDLSDSPAPEPVDAPSNDATLDGAEGESADVGDVTGPEPVLVEASRAPLGVGSREGEAKKRVDVDAGGETAIPQMNKRKWQPTREPVRSEGEGSPHPTRRKDITEVIMKDQGERANPSNLKEIGEAVTEKQDVAKDTGPKPVKDNNFPGGGTTAVASLSEIVAAYKGV